MKFASKYTRRELKELKDYINFKDVIDGVEDAISLIKKNDSEMARVNLEGMMEYFEAIMYDFLIEKEVYK